MCFDDRENSQCGQRQRIVTHGVDENHDFISIEPIPSDLGLYCILSMSTDISMFPTADSISITHVIT